MADPQMTPPKTVGLKRKNDGGPKQPTIIDKDRLGLRNALAGSTSWSRHEREKPKVTLPTLKFLEKKVDF